MKKALVLILATILTLCSVSAVVSSASTDSKREDFRNILDALDMFYDYDVYYMINRVTDEICSQNEEFYSYTTVSAEKYEELLYRYFVIDESVIQAIRNYNDEDFITYNPEDNTYTVFPAGGSGGFLAEREYLGYVCDGERYHVYYRHLTYQFLQDVLPDDVDCDVYADELGWPDEIIYDEVCYVPGPEGYYNVLSYDSYGKMYTVEYNGPYVRIVSSADYTSEDLPDAFDDFSNVEPEPEPEEPTWEEFCISPAINGGIINLDGKTYLSVTMRNFVGNTLIDYINMYTAGIAGIRVSIADENAGVTYVCNDVDLNSYTEGYILDVSDCGYPLEKDGVYSVRVEFVEWLAGDDAEIYARATSDKGAFKSSDEDFLENGYLGREDGWYDIVEGVFDAEYIRELTVNGILTNTRDIGADGQIVWNFGMNILAETRNHAIPRQLQDLDLVWSITITGDNGYSKTINLKPESIRNNSFVLFRPGHQALENQFIPEGGVKYTVEISVTDKEGNTWTGKSRSGQMSCSESFEPSIPSEYIKKNGFIEEDGKLYYYVDNKKVSGWFVDGGVKYYASSSTNVVINYSKKISGKYYVWNDETGLTLADGFVYDGVGTKCYEDGVQVIGWRHDDGSGPKVINGVYEQYSSNPEKLFYFLSTTGYMVTEPTYKLGGYIREFTEDHYVKPMNGLQTQGGELYYYVDGAKQTGWHTIDGTTYYFRASDAVYGRAATKWMYIGNQIYYFYATTSATPNALKTSGSIGGIGYTYAEDGHILYNGFVNCEYANAANSNTAVNIQKKNGSARYYKNGVMQTGWQEIDGATYYFYAIGSSMGSGYMCVDSRTIGGVWYEFTENGSCLNYICVIEGHDWTEANCTTPKTCNNCGKTEGDVQHFVENNRCTECGYLEISEGLAYQLNTANDTYTVKGIGTCTDTHIVIPSIYEGKPVVSIANNAFDKNTTIEEVTLLEGVNSIGFYSFRNCKQLKRVNLPEGFTTFNQYAFQNCEKLTSINIPEGVSFISSHLFSGCKALTYIKLPESVVSIGGSAFKNCTELTDIDMPESLNSIDSDAFSGCKSLLIVKIPNGVKTISLRAFSACSSLSSVTIPNSVTQIDSQAFSGCSNLKEINIPETVTKIGANAFQSCTSLKSVVIPKGVLRIENYTFDNCTSLVSIEIPDTVTYIGKKAFYYCTSLGEITIPEGVTVIFEETFYQCQSLTILELPEGLSTIEAQAFRNCNKLEIVIVPSSLKTIGNSAFAGCRALKNIALPVGLETIGESAFVDCVSLTYIKIPVGITSVPNTLFSGCTNLSEVELNSGITSIGKYAFSGCKSLENVEIPTSVTTIGYYAFQGCKALKEITISQGVTVIEEYTFYGCESLTNVVIPSSVEKIGKYAFYCTAISGVDLPEGLVSIEEGTFYSCKNLTSIVIPKNVTIIGKNAFYSCRALTDIQLPEGLLSIEYGAFDGCSALTTIDIPDTVTNIGERAFATCTNLVTIKLPQSLTTIGRTAFYSCYRMTGYVVIPKNVTSVGDFIFYDCGALAIIYCEVEYQPESWSTKWLALSVATVYWGDSWHYVDGVPTLN